jgi:hypothetical protein
MSLNVRKYYDDEEKPYWCVEKRSKINGRVIHERLAEFDNGKEAEELRVQLLGQG